MLKVALLGREFGNVLTSLAFGGLLFFTVGSLYAQDQSPLAQRLYREAPPAWSQHQDYYVTLEGINVWEKRSRGEDGKWTITRGRASWKNCNGNLLDQWEEREFGASKQMLRGENSMYIFVLTRANENKPWAITSVEKKDEESAEALQRRWNGRKTFCSELLVAAATNALPQLFQGKSFRCLRVESETTNGEELVRVTFTSTPEGRNRLKGGWVLLDPAHYWVIRRSEIELDLGEKRVGTEKWTMENEYQEGSNRHPINTKNVGKVKAVWNGRILEHESRNELQCVERPDIPDSEFTLSAYGLPEPFGVRPKKTPWYLWLGIGGIACLTLGAAVAWYRRRRASVATSSPA